MKHTFSITILLISLFFLSQVVGLGIISVDSELEILPSGEVDVVHGDTAIGARPDIEGATTTIYMVVALFIGTILLLLLIRYGKMRLWKIWYFLAVWASMTISLGVFIHSILAGILSLLLSLLKVLRPHFIVHNITEVLMYSGIALLFVPIINVGWMMVILVIIAAYDAFAVWKSKHMIKMAKFTMESKVFAGLAIPYKNKVAKKRIPKRESSHTAILGGGDVAFPLMFSGVVMEDLMSQGVSRGDAYFQVMAIVILTTAAVSFLMFKG
ncbi:presenilin family intramembrane aspartyl protease, partial [Nanoarchaeota archaeon]